jgi:hypothetical protein
LEGAIHVDGGQGGNEVLFEGADGSFGGIDSMVVGRH